MFRNPRENRTLPPSSAVLPSTGRPPTPPPHTTSNERTLQYNTVHKLSTGVAASVMSSRMPVLGTQPNPKIITMKKSATKQNQSILNFFGKAEKSDAEAQANKATLSLFFDDKSATTNGGVRSSPSQSMIADTAADDISGVADFETSRFNEDTTPVKRRKFEDKEVEAIVRTPSPDRFRLESATKQNGIEATQNRSSSRSNSANVRRRGGFIEESSDEEDAMEDEIVDNGEPAEAIVPIRECTPPPPKPESTALTPMDSIAGDSAEDVVPSLQREGTSMFAPEEFGDDDFENDEFFEEGEEFLERQWMREQREMEVDLEEDSKSESGDESVRTPRSAVVDDRELGGLQEESVATCPICSGNMAGLSESAASSHVNACLDGTAQPLPRTEDQVIAKKEQQSPSNDVPLTTVRQGPTSKRFQRAAIARPAQTNPFSLAKDPTTKGSAFSRLMSGHAEDAAWAEAASNEMQSRGKPAYQRTCPFYKIMPGLYICVDAFRYGKVEGQNAYFLSHFHSDHYVGLTSSWCHGPIYASKVTCNLMRQQLKVDAKWLVPLEFEKRVEVLNTQGVFVTMIPANHCPGSSLYLFEKVIGKNRDGSPKLNRILHCGDFRACPAHINHPLLRPEVMDTVTGLTKQQVIDTCYLDTTYLTPKYSFPGQHDVIDACAKMCISLSKEVIDANDDWEKTKMQRAGTAMIKFLEQGEANAVKKEEEEEDVKPEVRGRLLVVIGTYSIGKERMCLGIAKALKSKIYAPPGKMRICACLEDEELNSLLTKDPLEAQVHMQTLMEIRAETLHEYLIGYKGRFTRIVGFRPTGWTYRPPTSRFTENPLVTTVLHSDGWKSKFTMRDLVPQRGSTKEANCFGVPYSEHSSFRELTMFCCALRINRIVPTVNVGSAKSREKMKGWIEKWDLEKKKNGLFKVDDLAEGWGSGDGALRYGV